MGGVLSGAISSSPTMPNHVVVGLPPPSSIVARTSLRRARHLSRACSPPVGENCPASTPGLDTTRTSSAPISQLLHTPTVPGDALVPTSFGFPSPTKPVLHRAPHGPISPSLRMPTTLGDMLASPPPGPLSPTPLVSPTAPPLSPFAIEW